MRLTRTQWTNLVAVGVTFLVALSPAFAEGPELSTTMQFRIRWESFGTPAGSTATDSTYNFSNLRLRAGLQSRWEHVTLFGEIQGAAAHQFPTNGAFAIGPVYTAANGGETSPTQVGFSQAFAAFHTDSARVQAGRLKWADGVETMTGVKNLDAIKRRRMAERLVGNWDWVNVGRRFDGVSAGADLGAVHVSGYAFRPLAGGVNYEQGFERLDGLEIYGATLTGKYDEVLRASEFRFFAVQYDDDRPGAVAAAGGKLKLTTVGLSLLSGGEDGDFLIWGAYQGGDWGTRTQQAWAFILEAGRKIYASSATYQIRGGFSQASGDNGEDDSHRSFFNLLPTNHKFYGSMDYNAFSNLRNGYGEFLVQGGQTRVWNARVAVHAFFLVEKNDAWYGGSGAFDAARLGYAARRPAAGSFSDDYIGSEVDLSLSFKAHPRISLAGGFSHFWGGDAAGEILTVDRNGSWGFFQVVVSK